MNGATLFGIAITLFALAFALEDRLVTWQKLALFVSAYLYLLGSLLAFLFSKLSNPT